jgi:hypothetical protein
VSVSAVSTRWYEDGTCRALQHLGEGSEINLKDHFVAETGAEYPIAHRSTQKCHSRKSLKSLKVLEMQKPELKHLNLCKQQTIQMHVKSKMLTASY